ncbi:MAG TPA: sulfatase [Chloroflexota bacterium]|nr:sulfatase [Chloroflexota bacterium]
METPERPDRDVAPDQPALVSSRRGFLRRTAALGTIALGALLSGASPRGLGSSVPDEVLETMTPFPAASSTASTAPDPIPNPPYAVATPPVTPALKQPNVLLVTIDTLRADRIGSYGFALAHTPRLDQIAREGVRFDRAMCQLPQTDPAHAALMTGLYASTSGVKVHMIDKLRQGAQAAAMIFQSAGYQTAGFYSWLSLDGQYCGLDQGFQTYEGYVFNVGDSSSTSADTPLTADYQGLKSEVSITKTSDVSISSYANYEQVFDSRSDVTNQAVFAWLDAHVSQGPFFLWVHYFDPHFPYSPPVGYDHLWGLDYQGNINGAFTTIWDIYKGKLHPTPADIIRIEELYQGEIAFVDAQLGQLLDHLEQLGIKDDTIVTVTGDHGESFGEHGDWMHGLTVFETEIRVPLLMRYPRRLPAGINVTVPAQHIDVLPTLLDLTGLTANGPIQGTSLLPVTIGDANGSSRVAFTELANEAFVSVLNWGDWKLIRNNANDQLQLYNVNLDEGEQLNLAGDQMRITAELHARLLDLMKISGVSH